MSHVVKNPKTWLLCGLLVAAAGCASPQTQSGKTHMKFGPSPANQQLEFELLPDTLHAKACAEDDTTYNVSLFGMSGTATKGERAAAIKLVGMLEGKADTVYVTHSIGQEDDSGMPSCGEVWGRGAVITGLVTPEPGAAGAAAAEPAEEPKAEGKGLKERLGF